MSRRLLTLAAAGILLFLPAAAAAAPAPTVAGDIPIAEEFWGGPPPQCTSVAFSLVPPEGAGGDATLPYPGWSGPCELNVHQVGDVAANGVVYTAEYVCEVMVHEMGHLHGEGHSEDPSSIMYGGATLPPAAIAVPACAAAAPVVEAPSPIRRHRRFHRGADLPRPRG